MLLALSYHVGKREVRYHVFMNETFRSMLAVGGKSNSLGRAEEVVEVVSKDRARLDELYECLFAEDPWVRMRAVDALEKVCRKHPEWLVSYIDKLQGEIATSSQASIQWHLAQIYAQVELTKSQQAFATQWLKQLLAKNDIDWIVSANAMDTLVGFARRGLLPAAEVVPLLKAQQGHKSNAVIKRASKLLDELAAVDQ